MKRVVWVAIVVVILVVASATGVYYYENSNSSKVLAVYTVGELPANTALMDYYKNYSHLSSYSLYVGSAGNVEQKVLSEFSAHKYIDDIVIANPAQMQQLYADGDLLDYTPSCSSSIVSNPVLRQFTVPGYYYPMKMIALGIAVNTNYINTSSVQSYSDLVKPSFLSKWNGRIMMGDVRTTISADLYYFMNATYGPTFWQNMSAINPLGLYSKGSVGMDDLVSGKAVVLIGALDYQVADARQQGDKVQFIYPKEGVVLSPGIMGIAKNAPDVAQAKAFENWLCSSAGQQEVVTAGLGQAAYGASLPGLLSTEQLISQHLVVPQNETAYINTPVSAVITQWEQTFHISG